MEITNIHQIAKNTTQKVNKKNKKSSRFAEMIDNDKLSDDISIPIYSVKNNIFSIIDHSFNEIENNKAKKNSRKIIENMEYIRNQLAIGHLEKDALNKINTLIKQYNTDIIDPNLKKITDEIELRAAVELAKFNKI